MAKIETMDKAAARALHAATEAKAIIRYFAWSRIPGSRDGDDRQLILEVTKFDSGKKVERRVGRIARSVAEAARTVQSLNARLAFSPSFKGTEV